MRAGNVLLVGNWPSDTGYAWWLMAHYWIQMARYAHSQGRRAFVSFPSVTTVSDELRAAPVEIVEADLRDWRLRTMVARLRWLKRNGITHVYFSDYPTWSARYLLLRLAGVRGIVVHDHTPGERSPARGLKRTLKSLLNRVPGISADHVIAVTEYVRRRHLECVCVPPRKSMVVENGIPPIERASASRQEYREAWGIPEDAIVIASTGRANRYKRIDFIIRCLRALRDRGWETVYVVHCGDGPDLQALIDLAEDEGVEERMLFLGKRTDVTQLIQACDIGISASRGEVGYSLAILEYMAAGLATVVPDTPSTSMATDDGRTGILFADGDVEDCVAKLEALCADPDLRQRLGEAAMAEIRERFNLNKTTAALNAALPKLLE